MFLYDTRHFINSKALSQLTGVSTLASRTSPCKVQSLQKSFHLTHAGRIELKKSPPFQLLLKLGISKKKIAEELGVHRSTVYRELKRNVKKDGGYSARYAEELYQERKERFRRKRRWTEAMRKFVDEKLGQQQWSPEQIVGYCRTNGIPMVSHETWEKGLVENVNGLIRQYVPKKADFSQISPEYIRMIKDRLNNRPRKLLGWKTPMQVFLSNFVKPNQNVSLVT